MVRSRAQQNGCDAHGSVPLLLGGPSGRVGLLVTQPGGKSAVASPQGLGVTTWTGSPDLEFQGGGSPIV